MLYGTQDRDFFPRNFVDRLNYIKELGYDCYEVDGKELVEKTAEIKDAVEKTKVPVTTACNGYRGWIGDFIEERRLNGVTDLKEILRCIAEVGGTGVVIPAAWGMFTFRLPPHVSPRSHEGDIKAIMDSLKELDPVARQYGVYIYLEPLNQYQDHMLNLQSQAREIIDNGKFTNVKTTCDFYHMNREEDNISQALRESKDYIGHVHIADNQRYQPGSGSIDFKKHFDTLKQIGYDGPIIFEGRLRGNPVEVCKESSAFVKECLK